MRKQKRPHKIKSANKLLRQQRKVCEAKSAFNIACITAAFTTIVVGIKVAKYIKAGDEAAALAILHKHEIVLPEEKHFSLAQDRGVTYLKESKVNINIPNYIGTKQTIEQFKNLLKEKLSEDTSNEQN